jgi:hypothetical protein
MEDGQENPEVGILEGELVDLMLGEGTDESGVLFRFLGDKLYRVERRHIRKFSGISVKPGHIYNNKNGVLCSLWKISL